MTDFKLTCNVSDAHKLAAWITEGGVAKWNSLNLSDPGQAWLTAASNPNKPHWAADNQPALIVTDPLEIGVITYKEVKRFHVAVRRGSQGLSLKLTDASSERVRKAVEQAGDGATYQFDYFTQDAVILAPAETISLATWLRRMQAEAAY
jgi:hypothetical protein